ncbi:hypothetical protein [Leptospira sp. GIMC2001]|uniref:hypothetical protein n=1 Tax=Leptospira sp. GIMC2001 TaxID=1513297 RepID=UPI00234A88C6|nr:hypothetical protein [Leptospira sp. GIMC2001]WCL49421.1 hypothetical protein O4O04_19350 [Leptospira sp. GIMC2001]
MQNQKTTIKMKASANGLDDFLQKMVELVSGIEDYQSPYSGSDRPPEELTEEIIKNAAWKAGTISATCSLPGGAFGFLTLVPELVMIFRLQSYLVKDIAAIYQKEAQLTRELLLFCLFKHGGAHLFRKFIEETGVRILIRPTTVRAFQSILQKLGMDISKRVLRKNLTRWVPFAGAAITGSFAFFDTKAVGKNAIDIFSKDIVILPESETLDYDNNISLPKDKETKELRFDKD